MFEKNQHDSMNVHRQQIYPFSQHYYFQMNNFEETWYKSEEADVGWERTGRSLEYHSRNEADQTMIFVSINFFSNLDCENVFILDGY